MAQMHTTAHVRSTGWYHTQFECAGLTCMESPMLLSSSDLEVTSWSSSLVSCRRHVTLLVGPSALILPECTTSAFKGAPYCLNHCSERGLHLGSRTPVSAVTESVAACHCLHTKAAAPSRSRWGSSLSTCSSTPSTESAPPCMLLLIAAKWVS